MSNPPSGYNTPKTNWQSADVVLPTDLNRIEGNINAIEAGTRTVDPSQAPSSNQGTLRQLLDRFANRIRAITGTTNWYDAPPATLSGLSTIVDHLYWSSWTSRSSGVSQRLNDVAYGGGMWVVVGDDGTILTSSDGITWTSRTSGTTECLYGVAYGGGMWVVVGDGGTILTSTNGVNWTSRSSGVSQNLNDVAYGGGMWVAVGYSGTIIGTVPI